MASGLTLKYRPVPFPTATVILAGSLPSAYPTKKTAAGDFYGHEGEAYRMTSSNPSDPLVQGADGNFYATASAGGRGGNCGRLGRP